MVKIMVCKKILVQTVGWLETGKVALVGNRKTEVGKIDYDNSLATITLTDVELEGKPAHGVFEVPTKKIDSESYVVYAPGDKVLFYEPAEETKTEEAASKEETSASAENMNVTDL
jgi:hypothetical protein